jgi:hypothetical protein
MNKSKWNMEENKAAYDYERFLYQLTQDNKKQYLIKVKRSRSNPANLKLYYQYNEIAPNWLKFATCGIEEDIEKKIMLYFGNKGNLMRVQLKKT